MVLIFQPVFWFSGMLTLLVASRQSGPSASEDNFRAITSLSRRTGRFRPIGVALGTPLLDYGCAQI
jgi:hypothetical protein